ncbi:MAG: hypothetical protein L0Z62_11725 [Gemmataceae bacterium]|nr:hypothetical protein [Gemmataceae bacterium]
MEALEDRTVLSTWLPINPGTADNLRGLWGSGPNDLYAVGRNSNPAVEPYGVILHSDGTSWTEVPLESGPHFGSVPLIGVWGSGPGDVYAVGGFGTTRVIYHLDGNEWAAVPDVPVSSPGFNDLRGVWGSGPDDVFAVGSNGKIVHFDGNGWTAQTFPEQSSFPGAGLVSVWGSGADNVYAVGTGLLHSVDGGENWILAPEIAFGSGIVLLGIWGSSPTDIYAVGRDTIHNQQGVIVHYDGTAGTRCTRELAAMA